MSMSTAAETEAVPTRGDFPILSRPPGGKPLIYLDSAATSQKPRRVLDALQRHYETSNGNPHRGMHRLAEAAEAAVESTREKVARLIGARKTREIVFTRGTTESINLAARSWGAKFLRPGDEILLTELEHHSNLLPWQALARERGVRLRFIPIERDGSVSLGAASRLLSPRTKLVAFTAMSNALGTVLPIRGLTELAHENGAVVLVDAAQWVPHRFTDVEGWDCDFLAFSAHKMLGPSGVGVLYGKEALLEKMDPFQLGGGMIREVSRFRASYSEAPGKFEAGTQDAAGIAAFGAAIDYLQRIGLDEIERHERRLTARALSLLEAEPEVTIYGPREPSRRGGIVSFNAADLHPHDVGQILDMRGIAVRVGHHCCQPLMRSLGISGTVRASFYLYNTEAEVSELVRGVRHVLDFFRARTPARV